MILERFRRPQRSEAGGPPGREASHRASSRRGAAPLPASRCLDAIRFPWRSPPPRQLAPLRTPAYWILWLASWKRMADDPRLADPLEPWAAPLPTRKRRGEAAAVSRLRQRAPHRLAA